MGMSPTDGINLPGTLFERNQNMKNVGAQLRGQFSQEVGQAGQEIAGTLIQHFRYGRQEDAAVGYTPPEDKAQAAPGQAQPEPPTAPQLAQLGVAKTTGSNVDVGGV